MIIPSGLLGIKKKGGGKNTVGGVTRLWVRRGVL